VTTKGTCRRSVAQRPQDDRTATRVAGDDYRGAGRRTATPEPDPSRREWGWGGTPAGAAPPRAAHSGWRCVQNSKFFIEANRVITTGPV